MSGSRTGQIGPLLALRWRMIRSPVHRIAVIVGIIVLLLLAIAALTSLATSVERLGLETLRTQALVAYPVALLLFAVVAAVAPFLAGGAIELFPPAHMVAFPVTPRTRFALSLLLMPLNLTWLLQVVLLAGLVVVGTVGTTRLWSLAVMTTVYVVAATVVGQALAWTGTAVRQKRLGRVATTVPTIALVVFVAANADQESLFAIADRTPLLPLLGVGLGGFGTTWVMTLLGMVGVILIASVFGVASVGWTLKRGSETAGSHESTVHRRRRTQRSTAIALTTTMLGSVFRSKPIRRGLLLLMAFPLVVAAVADLTWSELVVLPGLVAAGAALLFGVNGLSLLGGGAAWLGSQPLPPMLGLRALAGTVLATIGVATAVTTIGVAILTPGNPTTAEVVSLVGGAVATATWVVATCLRWSVVNPYQADLRGGRDTPAPPGVMIGYSVRLALAAGLLGLLMVASAQLQSTRGALTIAAVAASVAAFRTLRTTRAWSRPDLRAKALLTVAMG